jgi:enoyl-CoA hydratase/carnithine racemase
MEETRNPNDSAKPLVVVERQGTIAWLTLNRPEAANALSRALVATLGAELASLAGRSDLTAVVIAGAAGKAFCAGADLKERLAMTLDQTRTYLDELGALVQAIEDFPRPVIAAISGAALGGGLEIALACDLRLADPSACMALSEVRLGIIPGAGGTQRLSRLCGIAVAKELILTGRRIDAATALGLGLVSRVVSNADLRATVEALCSELAAAGPLALAAAKRAIDHGFGKPMNEALAVERACYERVLTSQDRNEGLRAFAEKRPPLYQGR